LAIDVSLSVWMPSNFFRSLLLQFFPTFTKLRRHDLCANTQKTVEQIFETFILKFLAIFKNCKSSVD